MVNFYGFPPGVWAPNGSGQWAPAYFDNPSAIFSMNGAAVSAHPPIGTIVPSTTVGMIAPANDIYTTSELANTAAVLELANMKDYFNNSLGFPFSADSSSIFMPDMG